MHALTPITSFFLHLGISAPKRVGIDHAKNYNVSHQRYLPYDINLYAIRLCMIGVWNYSSVCPILRIGGSCSSHVCLHKRSRVYFCIVLHIGAYEAILEKCLVTRHQCRPY